MNGQSSANVNSVLGCFSNWNFKLSATTQTVMLEVMAVVAILALLLGMRADLNRQLHLESHRSEVLKSLPSFDAADQM